MTKICVYQISTGQARWNTDCPDGMEAAQTANQIDLDYVVVETDVNGNTHYIVEGVVTPRPTLSFDKTTIIANDLDTASMPLPGPATVVVDGQEYAITEAPYTVEIASPMPATYHVSVDLWPYLPFKADIIAS